MRKGPILLLCALAMSIGFKITNLYAELYPHHRTFFIEERITFKNMPEDARNFKIWVPYPVTDKWQAVEGFKLSSPFDADIITDSDYANKIIYLKARLPSLRQEVIQPIVLSFKVQRKEYSISDAGFSPKENLKRFLMPDRLVPVDGKIKALAEHIAQGKAADIDKVRAIYDYIIDELTYSKDDPNVCGIGNSLLTLEAKKGICTDYHSLFISLVRALGIPAKFEIGFRIPADEQEGQLNGYHCWAKFYLKDKGWLPVDISEADKHPEKRDYFFGHIDENRVHLTSGRDLRFSGANGVHPLNFFVYPYAEVNGVQFKDMDVTISFKEG